MKTYQWILTLAFLGGMAFSTNPTPAQTLAGVEDKWVCCQKLDLFCMDWLGNAYADSVRRCGQFC